MNIKIWKHLNSIIRDIYYLITSPEFILVTILGNCMVLLFSCSFYYLEYGVNDKLKNFMDALWWAFSTITTVGYGDMIPITVYGKILGICLMLLGTGIFATYTALFADLILKDKMRAMKQFDRLLENRLQQNTEALKEITRQLEHLKQNQVKSSKP